MAGALAEPDESGSRSGELAPAPIVMGKYELVMSLGRGGMAEVFLAVARGGLGFNKLVVVKRMHHAIAGEASFRRMFLDEARLSARLNHPNIVHTYEVGEADGAYFLALEYLEGQSLHEFAKRAAERPGMVTAGLAARIVSDALAGLHYAHTLCDYDGRPLGIIHRDVSPHNLFVTYDGHTKVLDFGIAKAVLSTAETEVGIVKGKVSYMAPEQALGRLLDPRADVFAMGIVLWELLAGQRLMVGEGAANILTKLLAPEPVPRLRDGAPGVDPNLEAIVMKALEKASDARWGSALEMREALEDWMRSASSTEADTRTRTRTGAARHDDVAHVMLELFGPAREETKLQIQRVMKRVRSTTSTQDLLGGPLVTSGAAAVLGARDTEASSLGGVAGSAPREPTSLFDSRVAPAGWRAGWSRWTLVGFSAAFVALYILMVAFSTPWGRRLMGRDALSAPHADARSDVRVQAASVPEGTQASSRPTDSNSSNDATPLQGVAAADERASNAAENVPAGESALDAPAKGHASTRAGASAVKSEKPNGSVAKTGRAPTGGATDKDAGFLTITAYPWARVLEGSRQLCAATPCTKIPLSPGVHTLTMHNPERGLFSTATVTIRSGEITTRAIGLQ